MEWDVMDLAIDLAQVRYFNAVARHRSFSAAARALRMTQPGLTKAVRRLEASLQCALFVRLPRGVALTEQGQALLRHASQLEIQLQDARDEVRGLARGAVGVLRVGAGPSWLSRALPRIVAKLTAEYPGLSFQVAGGFNVGLMEALRAGEGRFATRGGELRRGEVLSVTPSDGGIHIRLKDNAPVDAAKAVIACGAWSAPLARGLGDHIPLETERGYNTTLPPGSFDLRRQLTFGGHGFVITPLSSGIRVGGAVEFGGLAAPPNFARSEAMLHKAAQFLPGLKTDGGIQWMGCRPSLPDSLPVIGPSKATPNVIYAFGHGHLGLTQSAATGRLVADLVAQRWPSIDLAAFSPRRF
jgi:glycine/D-amino acid oxidase-like deaminating enzyme